MWINDETYVVTFKVSFLPDLRDHPNDVFCS
jgi:hypothetical protein